MTGQQIGGTVRVAVTTEVSTGACSQECDQPLVSAKRIITRIMVRFSSYGLSGWLPTILLKRGKNLSISFA
ncbi:hypothetical protein [Caballeronia sp. GAOx1]|uniref:hypothetical protein n=1 Tax=Caballeronia sp. GAOx1 TaxID=2921761 RepID=UPI002027BB2F|nr:hypothetical protein [Caballeronia sp. GAOx1]